MRQMREYMREEKGGGSLHTGQRWIAENEERRRDETGRGRGKGIPRAEGCSNKVEGE